MNKATLAAANLQTIQGPLSYVFAIENPSFKISYTPETLASAALRVADQRGFNRGMAAAKQAIIERLFA